MAGDQRRVGRRNLASQRVQVDLVVAAAAAAHDAAAAAAAAHDDY